MRLTAADRVTTSHEIPTQPSAVLSYADKVREFHENLDIRNKRSNRMVTAGIALSLLSVALSSVSLGVSVAKKNNRDLKKAESELVRANTLVLPFDHNEDKQFSDAELFELVESYDKQNALHKLRELIDNISRFELGQRLGIVLAEYELIKGLQLETERLGRANELVKKIDVEEPQGHISEAEVNGYVNRVVGADGEVFFSDSERSILVNNAALLRQYGFQRVANQIIDLIPKDK